MLLAAIIAGICVKYGLVQKGRSLVRGRMQAARLSGCLQSGDESTVAIPRADKDLV